MEPEILTIIFKSLFRAMISKVCPANVWWSANPYANQYFVLRGTIIYFKCSAHQKSFGTTALENDNINNDNINNDTLIRITITMITLTTLTLTMITFKKITLTTLTLTMIILTIITITMITLTMITIRFFHCAL
jgi:hypothetical protein